MHSFFIQSLHTGTTRFHSTTVYLNIQNSIIIFNAYEDPLSVIIRLYLREPQQVGVGNYIHGAHGHCSLCNNGV